MEKIDKTRVKEITAGQIRLFDYEALGKRGSLLRQEDDENQLRVENTLKDLTDIGEHILKQHEWLKDQDAFWNWVTVRWDYNKQDVGRYTRMAMLRRKNPDAFQACRSLREVLTVAPPSPVSFRLWAKAADPHTEDDPVSELLPPAKDLPQNIEAPDVKWTPNERGKLCEDYVMAILDRLSIPYKAQETLNICDAYGRSPKKVDFYLYGHPSYRSGLILEVKGLLKISNVDEKIFFTAHSIQNGYGIPGAIAFVGEGLDPLVAEWSTKFSLDCMKQPKPLFLGLYQIPKLEIWMKRYAESM
jgi:hypothetical protein